MRVGLTYDLRDDYRGTGLSEEALAEFDSAETISELEAALRRLGLEVERIGHVRHLARRLVAGDRWDFVFNIAEGLKGRAREAQVSALLEAYDIPYVFSDPLVMSATLDKAVAKRLVRDHGVPTAAFVVLESAAAVAAVDFPYPVFAKPVAEGTGKGCTPASRCANPAELRRTARRLLARYGQPVLVEPFLPGREFTVGIVGTGADAKVLAVMEIALRPGAEVGVYSYENKELCESRVTYGLAHDGEARLAGETALAAYRALGCRDAGRVDVRSDAAGVPQFLEVNPLAGIHPTHSDLPILAGLAGIGYDDLLGQIVAACLARIGLRHPLVASRRAAASRAA